MTLSIIYLVFIFVLLLGAGIGKTAMDQHLLSESHQASQSLPETSLLSLLIVFALAVTAAVLAMDRS
jgi:hypothetical protein